MSGDVWHLLLHISSQPDEEAERFDRGPDDYHGYADEFVVEEHLLNGAGSHHRGEEDREDKVVVERHLEGETHDGGLVVGLHRPVHMNRVRRKQVNHSRSRWPLVKSVMMVRTTCRYSRQPMIKDEAIPDFSKCQGISGNLNID